MCSEQKLKSEGLKSLDTFIGTLTDKESSLIEVLYKAQNIFGFLSQDVMRFIGAKLGVPTAKIFGVVSFYSYFTTEPKGRYQVKLCLGTACFVRGAGKIATELEKQLHLKMGETSADRKFSLEGLRCVGACGLAPVVMVNDQVYGKVDTDDVSKIIHECEG